VFKATQMITGKFIISKESLCLGKTCRFEIFLNIIIKIRKVDIQLFFFSGYLKMFVLMSG